MFSYFYHIPSAMVQGRWNHIFHSNNNAGEAAKRAVLSHFRGIEDKPHQLEIWLKRTKSPKGKIRRFLAFEAPDGTGVFNYDVNRIADSESDGQS